MSEWVTEEPIGNGYVEIRFDGFARLVLHEESGFFNPELLRKRTGDSVYDYVHRSNHRNNFIGVLKERAEPKYREGIPVRGTPFEIPEHINGNIMLHPALLLDYAGTCLSAEAFAVAANVVGEIFHRNEERMSKLSDLLACGKPIYCRIPENEEKPDWTLMYSFEYNFMVDKRGWFNTTMFLITHASRSKILNDFRKSAGTSDLIEYLRKRGLFEDNDRYYHPLLFLRLAAWIDYSRFVQCMHIVFCSDDRCLDALFRTTLAAAVTQSPTVTRLLTDLKKLLSKDCQPSTSFVPPTPPNDDFTEDSDEASKNEKIDCAKSHKEAEQKIIELEQKVVELEQKVVKLEQMVDKLVTS